MSAAPASAPDAAAVWRALEGVPDPEVPVLSLVELGVVRAVEVGPDGTVRIDLTPTFSGCPALHAMREEAAAAVRALGAPAVEVRVVLAPPWTTEWLSDAAREKLRRFGVAPPARLAEEAGGGLELLAEPPARCPRCDGHDTELRNAFGPTLCRAIHWCRACGEPFEAFKAV